MMIMIANEFTIVTLNIFCFSKILILVGSDAKIFSMNIIVGTCFCTLVVYMICHMAHFTTKEVGKISLFFSSF